jgi:hypothetical protein
MGSKDVFPTLEWEDPSETYSGIRQGEPPLAGDGSRIDGGAILGRATWRPSWALNVNGWRSGSLPLMSEEPVAKSWTRLAATLVPFEL